MTIAFVTHNIAFVTQSLEQQAWEKSWFISVGLGIENLCGILQLLSSSLATELFSPDFSCNAAVTWGQDLAMLCVTMRWLEAAGILELDECVTRQPKVNAGIQEIKPTKIFSKALLTGPPCCSNPLRASVRVGLEHTLSSPGLIVESINPGVLLGRDRWDSQHACELKLECQHRQQ